MMICESVECRPCIVKGCKCLFHRWVEHSEIVPPSPMVGGHGGGEHRYITALIECENGTITEVAPKDVKFVDNKINDYLFPNDKEVSDNG